MTGSHERSRAGSHSIRTSLTCRTVTLNASGEHGDQQRQAEGFLRLKTVTGSYAQICREHKTFQCHRDSSIFQHYGVLVDGFDSTAKSLRTLFPRARLGNCLRHALNKLPGKLTAIPSAMRQTLRSQFHTLLYRARQRKSLRVFALGQRLRHFVDHIACTAGTANGERVRRWFQDKKAGWYAVLDRPADAGDQHPAGSGP